MISQGADKGPAFASRIATRLFFGPAEDIFSKQCIFQPGVVFVVKSGDDRIDIVLCFHCDEMETQAFPPKASEMILRHSNTDKNRPGWLELAKQALPADETIQALENERK